MNYYRLKNTGEGSAKYGPCEICGRTADTMYLQREYRNYTRHDGTTGTTHHNCQTSTFGHRECLEGQRR